MIKTIALFAEQVKLECEPILHPSEICKICAWYLFPSFSPHQYLFYKLPIISFPYIVWLLYLKLLGYWWQIIYARHDWVYWRFTHTMRSPLRLLSLIMLRSRWSFRRRIISDASIVLSVFIRKHTFITYYLY